MIIIVIIYLTFDNFLQLNTVNGNTTATHLKVNYGKESNVWRYSKMSFFFISISISPIDRYSVNPQGQ